MSDIVERIARVLCLREYPEQPPEWHAGVWEEYIDDAKAVLTALREPTEAMLQAGLGAAWHDGEVIYAEGFSDPESQFTAAWQAMIDAALASGEG